MGITDPDDAPALRARLALALSGACVAAVALYAILRLIQALLYKEPNPAAVIWSVHTGYFWRAWTVCYAGAMVGFAMFAAAKRHEGAVCRALLWGLSVAAGLIVVQGLFVP